MKAGESPVLKNESLNAAPPPDFMTETMISQQEATVGAMTLATTQTSASPKSSPNQAHPGYDAMGGTLTDGGDVNNGTQSTVGMSTTPPPRGPKRPSVTISEGSRGSRRSGSTSSPVPLLKLQKVQTSGERENAAPPLRRNTLNVPKIGIGIGFISAMAASVEKSTGKTPRKSTITPRKASGPTPPPELQKAQSMRVKDDEGRTGMTELFELTKGEDNTIGIALRGCFVQEVEPGSIADVVGIEPGMKILRIGTEPIYDNSSGYEIQCTIESSPKVFLMEALNLEKHDQYDINSNSQATFTGSSGSSNVGEEAELFTLSVRQGVILLLVVVFVVSPLLVLSLALATAGFLALVLGWAFEETFYLAASVVVTPLGGQPLLTLHISHGDYSMGGNLYLTVLAALGVGSFGILQLCTAPAIAPLFSWTKTILKKKKVQEGGVTQGDLEEWEGQELVRKLSKWRMQTETPAPRVRSTELSNIQREEEPDVV